MNQDAIRAFLEGYQGKLNRTIIIVDFSNVSKWNEGRVSLGWDVGIPQLAKLVKKFSSGNQGLRGFYYGSDFSQNAKSTTLTEWCAQMLQHAQYSNFHIETKRVKYIVDSTQPSGYRKKCDMDVEMTIDLIKMQDQYDNVVLFSGDGDLVCTLQYLRDQFSKKEFYVFAARGHIGSEVIDAEASGLIKQIFYAEDFEYRLSRTYGRIAPKPVSGRFRGPWRS